MRLSLTPQQLLVQKQILAPKMILSMEILQLPVIMLQERIEQEMAENPLLEMRDSDPDTPEEMPERENPNEPADLERELVVDVKNDQADDFERLLNMGEDMPESFDDGFARSSGGIEEAGDRQHDAMANVLERPESLYDHLDHQLGELEIDEELYTLCERIMSALSPEDGYLRSSLEDLLPADADPKLRGRLEEALRTVQQLDPSGIAARDLKECLLLQLVPGEPYYREMHRLISHHLEDLRDNRLPAIEKATGFSIDTILEAWNHLRRLNPKPGAAFVDVVARTVTPDVIAEPNEEGGYTIRLVDDYLPSLYISKYYRRRLASPDCTEQEREFIRRKINAAQWLIEAIEQRRATLQRVSQAIVDYQQKFLDEGPEAIVPLKMQQIADQVKVHVTTVSRAVADKWMQTPRGIYPLRGFFVGGTTSDDGESVTWDAIRHKLQELVDNEDKKNPYSDDELVDELKKGGIDVARRTITKYRQKMGIPSSRKRRSYV